MLEVCRYHRREVCNPQPQRSPAYFDFRKGKVDERFQETYDQLLEIRNHLDRLTMTQAWSLRETDLYSWQRKLDRIDDSRRDGNFFDAEGHPADLHAQRVGSPDMIRCTSADFPRHCYTSFAEDMRTSTSCRLRLSLYRRRSYPSTISCSRFDAVWWR